MITLGLLVWTICNLITHCIALSLLWKHLQKFRFYRFRSIECISQSVEKIKNLYQKIYLARLILDRFSIDRKRAFYRSTSNRMSIRSRYIGHYFTRSIEANFWSIETRETWISKILFKAVFNGFSWTNMHHMNMIDKDWYQNWIPLML